MQVSASAAVGALRRMTEADCTQVAALHAAALPHGFFVDLGTRFLKRYHATFVRSPHATAWVAVDDGRVVGFLVGVLHPGMHGRSVLRRSGLRLAVAGAAALLLRPRLLPHFLRTRLITYARKIAAHMRRARRPTDATAPVSPRVLPAVLSHVAVDQRFRGRGLGQQLVHRFEEQVRFAGRHEVILASHENGDADAFYQRLGYQPAGDPVDGWRQYSRALGGDR